MTEATIETAELLIYRADGTVRSRICLTKGRRINPDGGTTWHHDPYTLDPGEHAVFSWTGIDPTGATIEQVEVAQ